MGIRSSLTVTESQFVQNNRRRENVPDVGGTVMVHGNIAHEGT